MPVCPNTFKSEPLNSSLFFFQITGTHRSRPKKMKGHRKVFEGRVTQGYRFVFQTVDDTYLLLSIGTHDILKRF